MPFANPIIQVALGLADSYYNKGGCVGICAQEPGHEDMFYSACARFFRHADSCCRLAERAALRADNSCMMVEAGGTYANFAQGSNSGGVAKPAMPVMHDNRIFTPDGTAKEAGKTIQGGGSYGARLWRTGRTKPTLSSFKTRCAPLLAMDLRLGYEPLTALLLSAH